MRSIWLLGIGAALVCRSGAAQEGSAAAPLESAEPVAVRWIQMVVNGAADDTWDAASPLFQQRLGKLEWGTWVRAQQSRLTAVGARRVVSTSYSKDERYSVPVEWAMVSYASNLPEGGVVYQRVWLARQLPTDWQVVDYTVVKDARAALTNAYFDVVPYTRPMGGWGFFPHNPIWVHGRPAVPPPPPPPPPRNIVLPKRPPG